MVFEEERLRKTAEEQQRRLHDWECSRLEAVSYTHLDVYKRQF